MQIGSTQELWHQMENSFSQKLPLSNDRNSLFYLVSSLTTIQMFVWPWEPFALW